MVLYRAGRVSAEVALARLLLAKVPRQEIEARANSRVRALLAAYGDRLAPLAAIDHAGAANVAGVGAMFDAAAAISPEASVAAYSFGDPEILARATDEIVRWLEAERLVGPEDDVIDLGCGIGRVSAALAPRCRSVFGVDVSAEMVRVARERHAAHNLRFERIDGTSLAAAPDVSCNLLLAIDTFPYLVQAGVTDKLLREATRVLRPGGRFAILNLSYRGRDLDVADAVSWEARYGFTLSCCAVSPFTLWDGLAFVFARDNTRSATSADRTDPTKTASFTSSWDV